jgi:hypothetical protein
VRDHTSTPGFRTRESTLVTTRLDAAIDRVAARAALYHQRWRVETALAHLKTTMPMEVLPCQTVPGVWQDLTVLAIADTLVRLVMRPSAPRQHVGVARSSCLDALRWLGAPHTGLS